MQRNIVIVVSVIQFTILSVIALLITDLHDRFFPDQLSARAKVSLDFGKSGLTDEEAFRKLGEISDRLGLGLVKVSPDLRGDKSGQVFIKVGTEGVFPEKIRRFGNQPDSEIRDSTALAHTYANGDYLVTGNTEHLSEFKDQLTALGVDQKWKEDNFGEVLKFLIFQRDFGITILAVVALLVSLSLYWLTVKARGRALRVLGGVSTWRILYEDLSGFLMAMVIGAAVLDAFALFYVGMRYGWVFVPYYLKVLLALEVVVFIFTFIFAFVLSLASWPSPEMIANREPAIKSLKSGSSIVKIAVFTLVLATVAPAFTAYKEAKRSADEQAKWMALSDQVVLELYTSLEQVDILVGDIVREAEASNAVALSLTFSKDFFEVDGLDLSPYSYISIINQRWLDLMLKDSHNGVGGEKLFPIELELLYFEKLPEAAKDFIEYSFPVWTRNEMGLNDILNEIKIYRHIGTEKLPLMTNSGRLIFTEPGEAILILVPSVHGMFDNNFLASAASSSELIFTGLEATQKLVSERGLQGKVRVVYVAEEGVLLAQVLAYFAWLRASSLVSLIVALAIAAGISAFITAVLKARRDFPLRLSGKSWWAILRGRVMGEWLVGAGLTILVMLVQDAGGRVLVAATGVMVLLILPLVHLAATRWVFTKTTLRQL
ncbi:MAG: hypothetical protein IMX03_07450 [Brockia lithotrophica]|nr:hypothetical protein [Brockia lithotrophica]